MITFGQTSMKRDGWTTGVPLNTEFVAGCSHGTMPAHMCGLSGHTPGTHTHTHTHYCLCQRAICFTHTQPLFSFHPDSLLVVLILLSCPEASHNCCHVSRPHTHTPIACFENVRECMREDAGGEKKSLSNSKR